MTNEARGGGATPGDRVAEIMDLIESLAVEAASIRAASISFDLDEVEDRLSAIEAALRDLAAQADRAARMEPVVAAAEYWESIPWVDHTASDLLIQAVRKYQGKEDATAPADATGGG